VPSSAGLSRFESHYYVIWTDVKPYRVRQIGNVMDAAGKEYHRRFAGFRGEIRQKPVLKVFERRENFVAAFHEATRQQAPDIMRGVFYSGDGVVYTYDGDDLEPVLKHECFHQFVDLVVGGRLPNWANEGLAEYFADSEFDPGTGHLRLGGVSGRRGPGNDPRRPADRYGPSGTVSCRARGVQRMAGRAAAAPGGRVRGRRRTTGPPAPVLTLVAALALCPGQGALGAGPAPPDAETIARALLHHDRPGFAVRILDSSSARGSRLALRGFTPSSPAK
jgi:hypothetical protein